MREPDGTGAAACELACVVARARRARRDVADGIGTHRSRDGRHCEEDGSRALGAREEGGHRQRKAAARVSGRRGRRNSQARSTRRRAAATRGRRPPTTTCRSGRRRSGAPSPAAPRAAAASAIFPASRGKGCPTRSTPAPPPRSAGTPRRASNSPASRATWRRRRRARAKGAPPQPPRPRAPPTCPRRTEARDGRHAAGGNHGASRGGFCQAADAKAVEAQGAGPQDAGPQGPARKAPAAKPRRRDRRAQGATTKRATTKGATTKAAGRQRTCRAAQALRPASRRRAGEPSAPPRARKHQGGSSHEPERDGRHGTRIRVRGQHDRRRDAPLARHGGKQRGRLDAYGRGRNRRPPVGPPHPRHPGARRR